ncbi:hypothetical protein BO78DRAFT_394679 [Aspergillus sclerotiicarbonarius CBS 121057]|uniref:Uncharacterized protein n=1 Tax=Aspergillus sclerotiicarbonarius (strain CBS 121057 / IBT 28362) TaxID=1448318 RepID=A0A319EQB1_ASPSB|nr:hypothetical protein BO78DRAFT_394679 [Aspergillus sclerotiicarbonarius CBS 121057]
MAHQPDGIAWNILLQNLEYYSLTHPIQPPASNLYLLLRPTQDQDISSFVKSFSQTLTAQISLERKKYPTTYDPPNENDLLIDDDTARRISPSIAEWARHFHTDPELERKDLLDCQLCHHTTDENTRYSHDDDDPMNTNAEYSDGFKFFCKCALPLRERKAHAFLRKYRPNSCYDFDEINAAAFFNIQVIKTLLLHGEMDPVLRVCSHPNVGYRIWRQIGNCYCGDEDLGWNQLYRLALETYLVLNVLYGFPVLQSQPQSQSQGDRGEQQQTDDYRNTKVYQQMLHRCTREFECQIAKLPHQQFFGIPDDHFHYDFRVTRDVVEKWPVLADALVKSGYTGNFEVEPTTVESWNALISSLSIGIGQRRIDQKKFPYGTLPFEVFLNCVKRCPYLPHEEEVAEVWRLLRDCAKLPDELIILIMDFAGYGGERRRLFVAHDPLNLRNREMLERYLGECWGTLVRCGMFAEALGDPIDWEKEVMDRLRSMFRGPKLELLKV